MDECLSLFFVQTLNGVTRTRTQEARPDLRRANTNLQKIIDQPKRAKVHQLKNCLLLGGTHRTTPPPEVLFLISLGRVGPYGARAFAAGTVRLGTAEACSAPPFSCREAPPLIHPNLGLMGLNNSRVGEGKRARGGIDEL